MHTHVDHTSENKNRAVAGGASPAPAKEAPDFRVEDKRPEAIIQRKWQEMANNSPQVAQLRAMQEMANGGPRMKSAAQLQAAADKSATRQEPIQKKENKTGLPDHLKAGIETLSGYAMDDVKVHYNSDRPVQLNAHAYAQGTDIHLGPGQEKHLPHEAWHVVQQKQGRVRPTLQMKGKVNLNDDVGLEREADVMGARVMTSKNQQPVCLMKSESITDKTSPGTDPIQSTLSNTTSTAYSLNIQRKAYSQAIFDRAVSGKKHEVPFRLEMEESFGQDLSNVNVYLGQSEAMKSLGARAATRGETIAFDTNRPNKELVAHELTHVLQNRKAGAGGGIQSKPVIGRSDTSAEQEANIVAKQAAGGKKVRVSALPAAEIQLDMKSAITDVWAERKYAEITEKFEFELGKYLVTTEEANKVADEMLGKLKQIVDAWAKATRTKLRKTHERVFDFGPGERYYGSFEITAKNVKKIFEQPNQPLRKKLNLIYYATRNNQIAKFLEVAALEIQAQGEAERQGVSPEDLQVKEYRGNHVYKTKRIKKGFAQQSGLAQIWKDKNRAQVQPEIAQIVKDRKRNDKDLPEVGVRSDTFKTMTPATKGRDDKNYDAYAGLALDDPDLHSITHKDISDLTTPEIRLLNKRAGRKNPRIMTGRDKRKYLKDENKKIPWETGRDNIEVKPNSWTTKEAAKFKARLDAGISGSTDLMMHVGKHLGFDSKPDLKRVRLALLGWMLSNRDHSFFEIMIAAEGYGVTFWRDENKPGWEYVAEDNFYPIRPIEPKVRDLMIKIGSDKEMPSDYLKPDYKQKISISKDIDNIDESKPKLIEEINQMGFIIPKDTDERIVAQILAFKEAVKGANFQSNDSDENLKSNRIALQNLMAQPTYYEILSAFPKDHSALTRAIIANQEPKAIVKTDDLTSKGIPRGVIEVLPEYKKYTLARFCLLIESAPFKEREMFTSRANEKIFYQHIRSSPVFKAVKDNEKLMLSIIKQRKLAQLDDRDTHYAEGMRLTNIDHPDKMSPEQLNDLKKPNQFTNADYWQIKSAKERLETAIGKEASRETFIKALEKSEEFDRRKAELEKMRKEPCDGNNQEPYNPEDEQELLFWLATNEEKIEAINDEHTKESLKALYDLHEKEQGAIFQYTAKWSSPLVGALDSLSFGDGNFDDAQVIALDKASENKVWTTSKPLQNLQATLPMLKALVSGLSQLPVYKGGTVFNSKKSNKNLQKENDEVRKEYAQNKYPIGQIVTYRKMLSTSRKEDTTYMTNEAYDIAFEISEIKTGRLVAGISNSPGEEEVLFPPGAVFKVTRSGVKPDSKKVWISMTEI